MIDVVITRKSLEAEDICVFELKANQGSVLPPYSAGAHIDVEIAPGLIRQYSLCNPPEVQGVYVIGVLKEAASRGGSVALHEKFAEGDSLRISEPRNNFPLAHDAKHSLLLAGGIGITPILSMAERLAKLDADFRLHYCTRSLARTAFFERITQADYAGKVSFHFDAGAPEQKLDIQSVLASAAADTHLYVCGPSGFMDWVLASARARGWPEGRLHKEYFSGSVQTSAEDASFDVTIASTGATFSIPPGKTVVEVLAQHGIDVPISCEQGVCGTCITRVLEGEPDHRDLVLSDAEKSANDQFTPCCSRAKSPRLVLDL